MKNINTTLNKISNWSHFKLIISDQLLITFNDFLPIYVQFNVQTFSGVTEKNCLSIQGFFCKKCKNMIFLKNNGF